MGARTTRWILMIVAVVVGIGSWVASGPVGADEMESASAVRGHATYVNYCGSCHGKQGEGDGPVAEYLEPKPADLTGIVTRYDGEFPTQTIHEIIDGRERRPAHGSPDMPVWGNAFKVAFEEADDEEISAKIDDLVAFLKSIQVEQ